MRGINFPCRCAVFSSRPSAGFAMIRFTAAIFPHHNSVGTAVVAIASSAVTSMDAVQRPITRVGVRYTPPITKSLAVCQSTLVAGTTSGSPETSTSKCSIFVVLSGVTGTWTDMGRIYKSGHGVVFSVRPIIGSAMPGLTTAVFPHHYSVSVAIVAVRAGASSTSEAIERSSIMVYVTDMPTDAPAIRRCPIVVITKL